jgi:NAD(P)-dependent dehydrogenase (short-subunit alcohol dehydrogenase family)
MLLGGKTVLVSGVGDGLGGRIAVAAAREGANVVLGARNEENLRAVAKEVGELGCGAAAYQSTDITAPDAVAALVALAEQRFGALDAVVNCAALDSVMGGFEQTSEQQWRDVFNVNVYGTMNVVRAALPLLKRAGGAIVFIGSQSAIKPPPEALQIAYASSKGALRAAMYHLAQDLGKYKIRVNTVTPSWMWGPEVQGWIDMTAEGMNLPAEQVKEGLAGRMPLGEIATVEEVAEAVVFFASDRARTITGQELFVNSGDYLH